ncbi:uncharacterized protein Dana_GF16862 [Drosophila ananassae]|uniref:pyridoxal 5'-phosphate synthase n=1 Tax=Drosophila ananassae TaxID=7217 RepID=B3LXC5_DROAN|nr:pyridoxine/pyridoxamine 5'-phosphate oxidase [Drosophila ananassae]EDV42769.2 uncharacterized protein Dana_GF16862 [Drosophila ananassae]
MRAAVWRRLLPVVFSTQNPSILHNVQRGMSQDASVVRLKYYDRKDAFLEDSIKVKNPFALFNDWLELAQNTPGVDEPHTAALATVGADGKPSNRFLLVKDFTPEGPIFLTNFGSRKALDITVNPNVAVSFYWLPLRRSVRVEGVAEKISDAEALKYFKHRPRTAQIAANTSPQSEAIPSRKYLEDIQAGIQKKLGEDTEVPLPNWGGYLVRPYSMEFWQGQTDRLHDRIRFRNGPGVESEVDGKIVHKGENGWVYERLAP